VGTLLLAATLAAYALAMTLGRGHFGALNACCWLAACSAAACSCSPRRGGPPLIRLALLRDPTLGAGLAASLLVSTVLMATLVVGPFYLSRALGLDAASSAP
jgi:hypothetical protein